MTNLASFKNLIAAFAKTSGYRFNDGELLTRALTHASMSNAGKSNYERLEFLGDRVLGLVICEEIFHRFPKIDEGSLARRFNYLVRSQTCAATAKSLGLEDHMIISTGVNLASGASGKKVLADLAEAVIGAIYIDGGLEPARQFILTNWAPYLDKASQVTTDAKTSLQEWALGEGLAIPKYREVYRTGPDHKPEFKIADFVDGFDEIAAIAASKRTGEQKAADAFLQQHGIARK